MTASARSRWIGYAAIALAGSAALYLGFVPPRADRMAWFSTLGPMLVQANLLLVVTLAGLWLSARAREREPLLERADAFALGALALALVALSLFVPGLMRLQSDESLLVGTAFGLGHLREAVVPHAGLFAPDGTYAPILFEPDKRGLLFPLLLRLVAGAQFALERGYWLNLALAWLTLAGIHLMLRRWLTPASALAVALLPLALPVYVWSVRSLGFETLNLCLIVWSAAVAARAADGRDREAMALLVALAPLMAQTRYESALLGALAYFMALVLVRARGMRMGALLPLLIAAPFLFLPFAWQLAVPFEHGLSQIGAARPFGPEFVVPNLTAFLAFWVRPGPFHPFGPLILLGALLGLASMALGKGVPRAGPPFRVLMAWGVAVTAMLFVILSYAWGDFRFPGAVRLGLPVAFVFTLVAMTWFIGWRSRYTRSAIPELLLAGGMLVGSLWSTATDLGYVQGELAPALNAARDWARSAFPGCRVVYASANGAFFIGQGFGALPPALAAKQWPVLVETMPEFDLDALVGVEIVSGSRNVVIGASLPEELSRFTLEDLPVTPTVRLRLVALDRADAPLPRGRARCPRVPEALLAATRSPHG